MVAKTTSLGIYRKANYKFPVSKEFESRGNGEVISGVQHFTSKGLIIIAIKGLFNNIGFE